MNNKLMLEDRLIEVFDGTKPIHRECKNVITRLDNDKYVVARTLDTRHALMELITIFESDKQLIKFLQNDELTQLKDLWDYTFAVK